MQCRTQCRSRAKDCLDFARWHYVSATVLGKLCTDGLRNAAVSRCSTNSGEAIVRDLHDGSLRRNARRQRQRAIALPRVRSVVDGHAAAAHRTEAARGGVPVSPRRHHVRRVWRAGCGRAPDSIRHRAAHHPARRVARARGRPAPARARAEPVPQRHLPRPGDSRRRPDAERPDPRQRRIPPGNARHGRARRHSRAHRRHRHRARRRAASTTCSRTTCACRPAFRT